jgi:hypothetical protein
MLQKKKENSKNEKNEIKIKFEFNMILKASASIWASKEWKANSTKEAEANKKERIPEEENWAIQIGNSIKMHFWR